MYTRAFVRITAITFFAVLNLLTSSAGAGVDKTVKFDPVDTIATIKTDFPYKAEFKFDDLPVVGEPALLKVKLKATREIVDTVEFRIHAEPNRYIELGLDHFSWPMPRKKDFRLEVPMRFLAGGDYIIRFEHRLPGDKGHNLYQLGLSFTPDGETSYFGSDLIQPDGCAGHFWTSNQDTAMLIVRNRYEGYEMRMGVPYNIEVNITPPLRLYEKSKADFKITTNIPFIQDIQFEWQSWPSMSVSGVSESWGGNARRGDTFDGSFQITPRAPGYGMIKFRVFGQNIFRRMTGVSETELVIYSVIDSSGNLVYLGDKDITKCGFDEEDQLYEFFAEAAKYPPDRPQFRKVRSQPDFERLAKDSVDSDMMIIQPGVLDSLHQKYGRKHSQPDSADVDSTK